MKSPHPPGQPMTLGNVRQQGVQQPIGDGATKHLAAIASLALVLVAGQAPAKDITWRGVCAGILHFDREFGLRLGGGAHEGESTCLVRRPDWQRVLRICAVKHSCIIMGVIHECPNIPIECSEVKRIFSIRR
jgi:hypothetical protein